MPVISWARVNEGPKSACLGGKCPNLTDLAVSLKISILCRIYKKQVDLIYSDTFSVSFFVLCLFSSLGLLKIIINVYIQKMNI